MERLLKAINFATDKHLGQLRKDNKAPYISHPLAVALIVSQISTDEDVVIAGILHDVKEDCNVSEKELREHFGDKVTNIIMNCSEDDTSLDWKTRKLRALKKVNLMDADAALVKTADILHNTYDTVQKVKEQGIKFFENFKAGGKTKIETERRRLEEFKRCHPATPLLSEIEKNIAYLEATLGV